MSLLKEVSYTLLKKVFIDTPFGLIRTPQFVYVLGIGMILFALSTIDFGRYIAGIAFLSFVSEYIRAIGLLKFSGVGLFMKFGLDIFIFGILWLFQGKLGVTNEYRCWMMLISCTFVSYLIIKFSHPGQEVISVSKETILAFITWMRNLI